ncbi:uncharacterized protein LTHEOB_12040 [Lasiodiplodia theobromae]|uniref:Uncharacterized protein n=1 Tax=Lasiodiplodia theobromae TaxID=45133 RepID=A0A5N5CXH8_9PEZI|nr:uncharacterized protein LTHEOB_12040 [Lasiodiplodia theobromae]KAB2570067.1 hypothetical protein DBV05_g11269 [Lasiodiplodia theobromae]KAF4536752.1 hypothetical protein LTHEOB_12040 [Lasiodiplodia theobromae]
MAAPQNGDSSQGHAGDADLAQAFKDLARGEQTASALENHLDALEARIEDLLAAADSQQSASSQNTARQQPQSSNKKPATGDAQRDS